MKTLLVLAKQSGLASAIRVVLDPDQYRVLAQEELWQAEPCLLAGAVDACVLDADLTDIQPIRIIKQIRRLAPGCPILLYAAVTQWEWEEEAYLLGVEHVLSKPVRGRLLNSLLDRLWRQTPAAPAVLETLRRPLPEVRALEPVRPPVRTLEALRHFSGILTHSLCSDALLKEFLSLLREIIGVNRAAIFLRKPPGAVAPSPASRDTRWLKAACALGLPASLLDHFELSLESGIARCLYRSGRILKSGSDEARGDLEIQKEFELLGAQVAIPILDRESLVGVAVFDGRLTGEFFTNEELALIFHMLEEVGLAIKNSWLHDQLAASHARMTDVLNQLTNGCVVVNRDLTILHANLVARQMLGGQPASGTLEFGELPAAIASRVFEVLKTSSQPPPFLHQPDAQSDTVYRATIRPFQDRGGDAASAVLLTLEDATSAERARRQEVEAANLRLIRAMASHLAHEIGNAMMPISMAQEFLSRPPDDAPLRATLAQAVADSVRRISRLAQQMRFLAREIVPGAEAFPVAQLVQEAFEQAQANHGGQKGQLQCAPRNSDQPLVIRGDRGDLMHALAEVLLNALQASPPDATVQVRWVVETSGAGAWLHLDVEDAGGGFSAEAARRATEPFYSTRAVGLGLGLTVARMIVESHHGRIEITTAVEGRANTVRITLPMSGEPNGGHENGAA